ncbi:NAD/FAD-utilizing enzyme apparently involved in cell division [Hahella sp. CCB-MM4]|uniref:hypothetical protein n=1 Tax=Hahella sp. (strain CCB-MM4) TaxID=1926491 RepID=UPI000B9B04DF|nr:hypothetical protein [Hahella sp. CCB-MM4]OZG70733.1 NAD/FAD-utilizing enzyme apparently involved in cell division [Hahella sp. CCB-MM4]
MNRHYYISDDLDDLESVEDELEANGINTEQIHVLSENDAEVEQHHLHDVTSFMKKDVVHSGEIGAVVGVSLAIVILVGAYLTGLTETAAGWVPFIFLSIVILGFSIWEGGLRGIQEPNEHFRKFQKILKEGKHIFFVDVEPSQEEILDRVVSHHHSLQVAGTGAASPHWAVFWQHKWHQFKQLI